MKVLSRHLSESVHGVLFVKLTGDSGDLEEGEQEEGLKFLLRFKW